MEERRKVAAYGLCRSNAGILLTRYVDRHSDERWWTLPGGKLNHGEDPISAVKREFTEETGLDITVVCLLGVGSRTHRVTWGSSTESSLHTVAVYYSVSVIGGALRNEVSGSTDQAAWFSETDIEGLDRAVIVAAAIDLDGRRPADGGVTVLELRPGVRN